MKTRSCVCLVCLLLCLSWEGKAQVIKLEGGVALAGVTNKGVDMYERQLVPFQLSAGIDYMDKGWYELSSSIGYLRKGGATDLAIMGNTGSLEEMCKVKLKLDYLTINTTFRIKKTFQDKYVLYAGVGPRVDFALKGRIGADSKTDNFPDNAEVPGVQKVIVGLTCEGGLKYMIDRYMLGVNISYLPSFMNSVKEPILHDRTFTFGLVLGYVL